MDMGEFNLLSRYWESHPPLHLMVAGYLGIKPRAGRDAEHDRHVLDMLKAHPGFRLH